MNLFPPNSNAPSAPGLCFFFFKKAVFKKIRSVPPPSIYLSLVPSSGNPPALFFEVFCKLHCFCSSTFPPLVSFLPKQVVPFHFSPTPFPFSWTGCKPFSPPPFHRLRCHFFSVLSFMDFVCTPFSFGCLFRNCPPSVKFFPAQF